jgi:nucleoside-diphosphate-sugar epimerase
MNTTNNGSILVTGTPGQLGAVGRTVTGLLLDRGLPVRAMVRREDDRAAALRAAGAEVVVGDLLDRTKVYQIVRGCRRIYSRFSSENSGLKDHPEPVKQHPQKHQ